MTRLYLSRLLLNPRSRQVQRETADPYQLHRTIMKAFGPKRDQAGVLHRLDIQQRTQLLTLLVQSQDEPDWRWLYDRNYLLPIDPLTGLDNPAIKQVSLPLHAGQLLRFRLRANPTIKKKREGKHSNRVPLVREESQIAWLKRKADQNGFNLLDTSVSDQNRQTSRKRDGRPPLTLFTVQFDGRLQIADEGKFQQAMRNGIGPAKAFGCGLLSIAPG